MPQMTWEPVMRFFDLPIEVRNISPADVEVTVRPTAEVSKTVPRAEIRKMLDELDRAVEVEEL